MTPNTPRPSSAFAAPAAPQAPAGSGIITKIIALVLTLVAIAAVYFAKDRALIVAGAALVATVTGLAVVYLKSYYAEEPVVKDTAGEQAIFDALATNRSEYIKGLATLKTALDVAAQENSAARESETVRQELGRARTELAALRNAIARA